MTAINTPIVTLVDGVPSTTSIAIAEGSDVDHASVIKLVRTYQVDLEEFGPLGFEIRKGQPLPQGGFAKATEFAILNEQQTTLLFTYMRNSEIVRTFKKRLVKEFYLLAHGKPTLDPMQVLNDPAAMRGLLLTYTEKVIALEGQVDALTPKALAHDRIADANGGFCITNAAKDLGVKPKALFTFLSSHHWIYRRAGGAGWIAYQEKLQAGYLAHKVTVVTREDGSDKTIEQVLVTPKGLAKLATIVPGQKVAA